MIDSLTIIPVVENTATKPSVLSEHGLAFWIEAGQHRILLDTGQGRVLKHNLEALGITEKPAAVVLSHGHYDHTGAIDDILQNNPDIPVYLHPDAMEKKFSMNHTKEPRYIGIGENGIKALKSHHNLKWTIKPTQLTDGIWLTGEIPRTTKFEDVGGKFLCGDDCVEDRLCDDQAMFIETKKGLVVILGCAHSGVVNTLAYIKVLRPSTPIYGVLGGMHLLNANEERLQKTVKLFNKLKVNWIAPCHCTGFKARSYLFTQFKGSFREVGCGSVMKIL